MRPTPWTSGLGALVLMALVVMYVIGALWPARRITRA